MEVFTILHCYKGLYGGFYYPYPVIRVFMELNNVNNRSLFRPHNDGTQLEMQWLFRPHNDVSPRNLNVVTSKT